MTFTPAWAEVAMVVTMTMAIMLGILASNFFVACTVDRRRGAYDDAGIHRGMAPEKPFLCAISMVRNEPLKVQSFISHYLFEGFDTIFVVDDRSEPPVEYTHARVHVRQVPRDYVPTKKHIQGKKWYHTDPIRHYVEKDLANCTWVASMDIDELLTTRRHAEKTVREQLIAMRDDLRDVNVINVPWIFFSFDGDQKVTDMAVDMTCRWNHSAHHVGMVHKTRDRYDKIETKPIFRPQHCNVEMSIHCLECENQVDGGHGRPRGCNRAIFHEEDIKKAFFAVHHYRFLDKEDIKKKCHQDSITSYPRIEACEEAMLQSNHCEIKDDIMRVKYFSPRKPRYHGIVTLMLIFILTAFLVMTMLMKTKTLRRKTRKRTMTAVLVLVMLLVMIKMMIS